MSLPCSVKGCWLGSATADVTGSGLVPQGSLSQACSFGSFSPIPATVEVPPSGLLPLRFPLVPVLAEIQAPCTVLILNYMLFNSFD